MSDTRKLPIPDPSYTVTIHGSPEDVEVTFTYSKEVGPIFTASIAIRFDAPASHRDRAISGFVRQCMRRMGEAMDELDKAGAPVPESTT